MDGANFFLALAGILILLTALKMGFVGMAALYQLTWPRASERMLEAYRSRSRRCFWVGAGNFILLPIVALLLIKTEVLAIFGLLLLFILVGAIVIGYGVGFRDIGLKLVSSHHEEHEGHEESTTRTILRGGALAEVAFLAPVLGQIFSMHILLRGLGAVVIALMIWRKTRKEATPDVAPTDLNEV